MCAHRGPPLKLWYHTPKVTDLPHETVVGWIAFTSTSPLAAAGISSKTTTAAATPLRHASLRTHAAASLTMGMYRRPARPAGELAWTYPCLRVAREGVRLTV